ncbi:putative copia-like retroelement [Panicum miliaceum]|uniref:Copia-like retroelement n=1 Tax=Panicum miliaceum TaxID=4540 RepID=A0A3L6PQ94_PANMI|nr:putative copia-like retroelement [Panicum miliaceum]
MASRMTREVKRLRKINPYNSEKTSTDYRFYNLFYQDFYELVILGKITIEAQWVDWNHMERENDPLFKEIISACENKKIKKLMGFNNHWNRELIAQFYSTVFFGSLDGERAIFWMTEGQVYRIKFKQFARLFGLDRNDINRPKIHL